MNNRQIRVCFFGDMSGKPPVARQGRKVPGLLSQDTQTAAGDDGTVTAGNRLLSCLSRMLCVEERADSPCVLVFMHSIALDSHTRPTLRRLVARAAHTSLPRSSSDDRDPAPQWNQLAEQDCAYSRYVGAVCLRQPSIGQGSLSRRSKTSIRREE